MPWPDDDPAWEAALDKAEVCLAAGIQPSEYDGLSDLEREAFVRTVNEHNKA